MQKNSIQQYLSEIAKIPPLTEDEKIELGVQITVLRELLAPKLSKTVVLSELLKDYRDCLSNHIDKVPSVASLAKSDRSIVYHGVRAFNYYTRANLRLVVFTAKKYNNNNVDFLSIIQFGNLGLIKAIEKFDFSRNNTFSTYAFWWIKQFIDRGLTNTARTIRLPIHVSDGLARIKRVTAAYKQQYGSRPDMNYLVEHTKLSESFINLCFQSDRTITSLNKPMTDDDTELQELISDSPAESSSDRTDDIKALMVANLKPDEYKVMFMQYFDELTLKEICSKLGISKQIVIELQSSSIVKLKSVLKEFA